MTFLFVPARPPLADTPPLTDQAGDLDRVWSLYLWIALGVGVLVVVLLAWVVARYRRRSPALPRQKHQNLVVEGLYTAVPLAVVAALFAVTVVSIRSVENVSAQPDVVVQVTGFRWQWRFDYPAAGARSEGTPDQLPELVLPASSTVRFELTSLDVIHSFWVPGFRFKRDVIPDRTSAFEVRVGETLGSYPGTGVCAEFCGLDHHKMLFDVRIVTRAEFDAWTAAHRGPITGTETGSGSGSGGGSS